MRKTTYELSNTLSSEDLEVLEAIYLFRCLTIRQIYRNFYTNQFLNFEHFESEKLKELLDLKIVEKQEFNRGNNALFLTSAGVEIVRFVLNLSDNIIDPKKKVIKRNYYRAGELKMLPRLINHQVYLNQFVLDFKKKADTKNLKWKHYGEKHVSQYANIRPDGLIQIFDIDLFLEMDMNTESQKQLADKWQNYRNFLASREFSYKEKRIIVLFIIENVKNEKVTEKRKDMIRYTASKALLDIFDGDFDIYIGTNDELMSLVFNKLIPNVEQSNERQEILQTKLLEKFNFTVNNGDRIKQFLNNSEYKYYVNEKDVNGDIVVKNGKIQEYLIDDYFHRPLSVLKRIAYLETNSTSYKATFGRDISYIVITNNIEMTFHDLEIAELVGVKNVYFTTLERIEVLPFCEAVFQYDSDGNTYHFTNEGLTEIVFEERLKG